MKPTQTDLAKYIGITRAGITKMKKDHPKKFSLIWNGWINYLTDNKDTQSTAKEL